MARPRVIIPVAQDEVFIKMVLYGDPGVGKTVLAGTSPNALFLAADPGTESAARFGSTAHKYPINNYGDLTEAYEYLRHEQHGYEWVWLDSITYMQEIGLDEIMQDTVARSPHRKRYAPDKGEYGQNMNRLMLLVRELKSLPLNFGVIAHAIRLEDDETGKVLMMPAVQGRNRPDMLCGYMGVVAYMYTVRRDKKYVRAIKVQKDGKHYAKDRFSIIPSPMNDPTMPAIIEAVEGVLPSGKLGVAAERPRRTTRIAKKTTRRTTR